MVLLARRGRRRSTARARRPRRGLALLLTLAATACGGDAEPEPTPAEETPETAEEEPGVASGRTVEVYFTREERVVAVARRVEPGVPPLEAAVAALLEGPTADERARGLSSWFSEATAGSLIRARIDGRGRAVIDFRSELARAIPNASSSAGSAALLAELNATVFQFPQVRSAEYRFDGNCEAFWNWLQRACRAVPRPPAPPPPPRS